MKCPICEGKTKVSDSRMKDTLWRRRSCKECDYKFTTHEMDTADLSELFEDEGFDWETMTKINEVIEKKLGEIQRKYDKKISQDDWSEVKRLHSEGLPLNKIAPRFNVSHQSLYYRWLQEVRSIS